MRACYSGAGEILADGNFNEAMGKRNALAERSVNTCAESFETEGNGLGGAR